jgi:hypothetical protein
MENLNQFLQKLKIEIDKIPPTKTEFNVFTALNLETDEVYCHSQLITEFLNPQGSHGKGNVFLNLFLQQIGFEKSLSANVRVLKENKKIDIQILDSNWAIIIENKIGAGDQPNQLWRYHEKLNTSHHKNKAIFVLYLTLYGDEPSLQTLEPPKNEKGKKLLVNKNEQNEPLQQGQVYCISYKTNITNWLENCIKETATEPFLRETIAQYLFIIKKITGQMANEDKVAKIREALEFHKIYESLSFEEWKEGYISLRHHTQYNMWKNLEEAFSSKQMADLLEIQTNAESLIKPKNLIWDFSKNGSKNCFGLVWQIKGLSENEIWEFRIEYNPYMNKLYMGFTALRKERIENFEKKQALFNNFELNGYEKTEWSNEHWLLPHYIKKDNTHFDFTRFNKPAVHRIVEENDSKAFAEEVATAAHSIITQFIANLQNKS